MAQQVGCEGYDYPDDPFILKGSCQLVYSLKGPRKDQRYGENPSWDGRRSSNYQETESKGGDFGSRMVTWAVLGVIGYVVYNAFQRANRGAAGEFSCQEDLCMVEGREAKKGGGVATHSLGRVFWCGIG